MEDIPTDWTFVGYRDWAVSDLRFERWNIRYKREVWVSPCGRHRKVAALPLDLVGSHFGATLKAYVLNQYHSCGVTQPLLYQQLKELGVCISKGQLNNLLIEGKEGFAFEEFSFKFKSLCFQVTNNEWPCSTKKAGFEPTLERRPTTLIQDEVKQSKVLFPSLCLSGILRSISPYI